jgi:lipopolysaccharide transport system ATP-binding protein
MIRVEQLSKRFMIYGRPLDRLADWLLPARLQRGRPFWALKDLSFEVPAGCSMGVVGVNGAGKSTLLKILTGTTLPTQGSFQVRGRVSSLLELGTGFHPEFTGRQNLIFGAKMAGLRDDELAAKFDSIIDFSELGSFIEQPVRTYSSGMVLRLGFALASSVDPDVLIIDEALSVGDIHFQQKCLRRIRQFHERGTTVLFVSHDPSMVKAFCTEAILLDEGRLIDHGAPDHVLDYYTALLAEKYREGGRRARIVRPGESHPAASTSSTESASSGDDSSLRAPHSALEWSAPPLERSGHRTGNFQALITSVYLKAAGAHGNAHILTTGARARLCVRFVALEPVESATVGIMLKDRLGQEIYGVNTQYRDRAIGPLAAGEVAEVAFDFEMNLGEGNYSVTAAIHTGENHTEACYDWVEQAATIQILPSPLERFTGLCRLPSKDLEVTVGAAAAQELAFARSMRESLEAQAQPAG